MAEMQKQQEEVKKFEEQKANAMHALLDQDAKEHLNNIRMVKPEKADKIEMAILKMMQQGAIQTKITKSKLTDLIQQFDQAMGSGITSVNIQRKPFDDSDDDLDLDNL